MKNFFSIAAFIVLGISVLRAVEGKTGSIRASYEDSLIESLNSNGVVKDWTDELSTHRKTLVEGNQSHSYDGDYSDDNSYDDDYGPYGPPLVASYFDTIFKVFAAAIAAFFDSIDSLTINVGS